MIFTNNLSPILFEAGPLQIHWYGLMYAIGLTSAYLLVFSYFKKRKYPLKDLDSLAIYLFVGMLVGARLGHVFFYEAAYYLEHPLNILKVWNGGLASHGGAIGVFVAYLIWMKIYKVKFSKYPDLIVLAVPLLAGFIRVGNFFNSEIVGTPTNGNWGVIFARLGENFPRHPVQLYAALMDWLIFVLMIVLYNKYHKKVPKLFFMFFFMLIFFIGRFTLEFWKDLHGPIESLPISMGQLLSIVPILISAIYFAEKGVRHLFRKKKRLRS